MRLIKLILYIYLVWTRSRSKTTFLLLYRPPAPKCRKSCKVEFYFLQNVLDSFLFPNGDQLQETFKHVYSGSYLSIEVSELEDDLCRAAAEVFLESLKGQVSDIQWSHAWNQSGR